jgi:hypothetical protein
VSITKEGIVNLGQSLIANVGSGQIQMGELQSFLSSDMPSLVMPEWLSEGAQFAEQGQPFESLTQQALPPSLLSATWS